MNCYGGKRGGRRGRGRGEGIGGGEEEEVGGGREGSDGRKTDKRGRQWDVIVFTPQWNFWRSNHKAVNQARDFRSAHEHDSCRSQLIRVSSWIGFARRTYSENSEMYCMSCKERKTLQMYTMKRTHRTDKNEAGRQQVRFALTHAGSCKSSNSLPHTYHQFWCMQSQHRNTKLWEYSNTFFLTLLRLYF